MNRSTTLTTAGVGCAALTALFLWRQGRLLGRWTDQMRATDCRPVTDFPSVTGVLALHTEASIMVAVAVVGALLVLVARPKRIWITIVCLVPTVLVAAVMALSLPPDTPDQGADRSGLPCGAG